MSNETQHTPADVRERVARECVEEAERLRHWHGEGYAKAQRLLREAAALLRTPRGEGEGEAQPWRKVGEEPPPDGVQVLVYDPHPDGYSYAGCWAYTLFRKGDQFYLDGERCDEEDRRRLRIEEWLWQPLPPYPGSRSKDDDVRDDALRDGAQGDAEALAGEILAELRRAREKFPDNNVMTLALVEEVGELAKATFEESRDRVRQEAIQVAVMAMRVVLDGDRTLDAWREAKGLDPLVVAARRGADRNSNRTVGR